MEVEEEEEEDVEEVEVHLFPPWFSGGEAQDTSQAHSSQAWGSGLRT